MEKNLKIGVYCFAVVAAWSFIILPSPSLGQSFPTHPVSLWVGFAPGGATDIVMRALAEGAEKSLRQKIVIVNKPGGGGAVCASQLAKMKPDGYTLAGTMDTPVTRAPHMEDLGYEAFRDLTYILRVGINTNVFVVRADSPFKKWQDAVDWARKNPNQLVYGHTGIGTGSHLRMAMIASREKFTYKNVPFAGDGPALSALLGGHVMMTAGNSVAYKAQAEAKEVRLVLIVEKEGLEYAPDTPTFEKVGYSGLEMLSSMILFAPAGISDEVRGILEKAFLDGMKTDLFKTTAKNQGLSINDPLTGKEFTDHLKQWSSLYEEYIKQAGLHKSQIKK
jgi:tripartite-type tricarboxylate transporter receptor subunit TctC